jgi:hypothetical protein
MKVCIVVVKTRVIEWYGPERITYKLFGEVVIQKFCVSRT